MNQYHEHPLRILKYSAKNIWLLIFPLIRGLMHFPFRINREWLYEWLSGAWFDILIIVLIIIFGLVRWYSSLLLIDSASVTHLDGVIIRVRKTIPYSSISSTSFEHPFYLRPFHAVTVKCDTSAGLFRTSDMKLLVSSKVSRELSEKFPGIKPSDGAEEFPEPSVLSLILFSAFFSSGATGIIYLATFFYKGGDIARDMIGRYIDKVTENTERFTGKLLMRLPDAAVGVGALFIGAWLLSFLVNLVKYARFSLFYNKTHLRLSYGAITRKSYSITASHINYIDFRQNLIMKVLRMAATHISCAGYGNSRKSLPVLIPVRRLKSMGPEFEKLGAGRGSKIEYKPKIPALWNYIWLPVIVTFSLVPAYLIVARLIPALNRLTVFVAIMAEIPAVWMILVKFAAFFTSGIAVYDDRIKLSYSRFTIFHTVIAERRKLVKIEYEQTLIQKLKGRCSMIFWFEGEVSRRHKIKAIPVKDVITVSEMLGTDVRQKVSSKRT